MLSIPRKIQLEKKTIQTMVGIYCREKHVSERPPCPSCQNLLDYARVRLEKCPFGENKTACADCAVHCYQPQKRREVIQVMRFAGPRMTVRHPVMALFHWMRKRKHAAAPAAGRSTKAPHLPKQASHPKL